MDEKNYTPDLFIIPSVVMLDKALKPLDAKVYAMVYWFEQMSRGKCSAGNATIAKSIHASTSGVAAAISRLRDAGFLIGEYDNSGERESLKTTVRFVKPNSNEVPTLTQSSNPPNSNEQQNKKKKEDNTEPVKGSREHEVGVVHQDYLKHFIAEQGIDFTREVCAEALKRYRLTPKRSAAILRRLNDAGLPMLRAAIVGYGRADWSNGHNDRRWKADLADFICRSYENVERGARLYEEQRTRGSVDDAWAKL